MWSEFTTTRSATTRKSLISVIDMNTGYCNTVYFQHWLISSVVVLHKVCQLHPFSIGCDLHCFVYIVDFLFILMCMQKRALHPLEFSLESLLLNVSSRCLHTMNPGICCAVKDPLDASFNTREKNNLFFGCLKVALQMGHQCVMPW